MSASRIEAMIQQLEPAFLAGSRRSAGALVRSPDATVLRKSKRQEELAAQISALSAAADDKEDTLRKDIDDVEIRLEGVLAAKRRVKEEEQFTGEAIRSKKEALLVIVQKLQKQYDELEEAQHNIESGLDSDQMEKFNALRSALRPLEDAEHAIKTEKDRLARYNEQFNERLVPLQESLSMTREDIRAHVVAMEDALQARRVFEGQLTVFKEKHEEELADFLEELETREMLKSIRSRKADQIEKVKKIDKKIVENEKQLLELRKQLHQHMRRVTSPSMLTETNVEIMQIETFIDRKVEELGLPPLPEVVTECNKRAGFDLEEMITRAHVDQIDKKERTLEEEWKDEVMTLESELSALQGRLTIDEKALAGQIAMGRTPDSFLEKTCREEKAKAAAYIESISEMKARNRRRQEAISRWKLQNRVSDTTQKAVPASDADVLVAFAEAVAEHTSDADEQEEISNQLKLLSERLQAIAEQAGIRDERQRKRREAIDDLSSKVQSAEFQKSSTAMERGALQKELTKLITTEKAVSKRFEQMKMKAESSQKRAHEDLLSSELSSRSGEMSMIFKTMNNKAQQRLADKTKQELARTVTSRQRDRRARLEEKYQEYESWDRVAHWHTSAIEDSLRPQYERISTLISSLKRESERLKAQLQAIVEAEDDISVKTESIVEQKRKVLRMSLNQAAKALQAHIKTRKLEALKSQLVSKVQKLEDLERQATDLETSCQSRLSTILLEEAQLKTRLSQLQGQMSDVGADRETASDLHKKLRAMGARDGHQSGRQIRTLWGLPKKPVKRSKSLPSLTLESLRRSEVPQAKKLEVDFLPNTKSLQSDKAAKAEPPQGLLDIGSQFEIRLSECSKSEAEFFAAVSPLLVGIIVYKGSASKNTNTAQSFDPLEHSSPESFNYSLRELRLSKPLSKLEFRQVQKPGVDYTIMTSQLLDTTVPKLTNAVIAAQKKSAEKVENALEEYQKMKEAGTVNYNSPVVVQLSKKVTVYPFVLNWAKGGRLSLLARSPIELRQVCEAVKALLRCSKDLTRLKYKVE